ncbi:25052_t:CDS:2, partial [Dentiscutata erythropus]
MAPRLSRIRDTPYCFCKKPASPAYSEEFGLIYECANMHQNFWMKAYDDNSTSNKKDNEPSKNSVKSSRPAICGFHIHKDTWDIFFDNPDRINPFHSELSTCSFFNFTFCAYFRKRNNYSLGHPPPPLCFCGVPVVMRFSSRDRRLMFVCRNYLIDGARPKCTWHVYADQVAFEKPKGCTHQMFKKQITVGLVEPEAEKSTNIKSTSSIDSKNGSSDQLYIDPRGSIINFNAKNRQSYISNKNINHSVNGRDLDNHSGNGKVLDNYSGNGKVLDKFSVNGRDFDNHSRNHSGNVKDFDNHSGNVKNFDNHSRNIKDFDNHSNVKDSGNVKDFDNNSGNVKDFDNHSGNEKDLDNYSGNKKDSSQDANVNGCKSRLHSPIRHSGNEKDSSQDANVNGCKSRLHSPIRDDPPDSHSVSSHQSLLKNNDELSDYVSQLEASNKDLLDKITKLEADKTFLESKANYFASRLEHYRSKCESESGMKQSCQKKVMELQCHITDVSKERDNLKSSWEKEREERISATHKCKVCFSESITHAIFPCYHMALCGTCVEAVD